MPPNHPDCREIQELLLEVLSGDSSELPEGLRLHLSQCSDCHDAVRDLLVLKSALKGASQELPAVARDAWPSLAARMDHCPQMPACAGAGLLIDEAGPSLLAQYVYLVVLGLTVWTCLVFGQPLFAAFLQSQGLGFSHWFLEEYGLFLLFFTSGAFVAILAAPILIGANFSGDPGPGLFRQIMRAFSGKLRLFAC